MEARQRGIVKSVNISQSKGTRKTPIDKASITLSGINGDAHGGEHHRQISLLALEDIVKFGSNAQLGPGDFAENITTEGIDFNGVPVGASIELGSALAEVSQIGKNCHTACDIREKTGDCIMPKKGVFAKVIKSGEVNVGDEITLQY